ncbi:FAD/NAD(P)-binding protein [Sphingobacterium lactis]|uniref:FAD/NAD(P)-binding protein n=1 Tax=Sphingobacterium lactis TaxID=797291 RepID=UPI003F81B797
MIWTSLQLPKDPNGTFVSVKSRIKRIVDIEIAENKDYVSIIGGGIYGLKSLLSLLRKLKSNSKSNKITSIHWYNKNEHFATGKIYSPNQPIYLSLDHCIQDLNLFDIEVQKSDFYGKSFQNWLIEKLPEDQTVDPFDYCSKELFGLYLIESLCHIMDNMLDHVELNLIQAEVTGMEINNGFARLNDKFSEFPFKYRSCCIQIGYENKNNLLKYIPNSDGVKDRYFPDHRALESLERIPEKGQVAIKESGLEAVNTILTLTEGRGGIFYKKDDEVKYIPSGLEPIMYLFSRSNLPSLPRNKFHKDHKYQTQFMTNAWVQEMLKKNTPLNFEEEILPVLNQEIQYAFYSQLPHLKESSQEEILSFIAIQPSNTRFSLHALFDPWNYSNVSKSASFNEFAIDLAIYCLMATQGGEKNSMMSSALAALREGYHQIRKLYAHAGLNSASHFHFDTYWKWYLIQIGFGPNRENTEKFYCLMKEGYVNFLFSETPDISIEDEQFLLRSKENEIVTSYLIDCKNHRGNIQTGSNSLFKNLLKNNLIREFHNGEYNTGKIDLDSNGRSTVLADLFPLYFNGPASDGPFLYHHDLDQDLYPISNIWAEETIRILFPTLEIEDGSNPSNITVQ